MHVKADPKPTVNPSLTPRENFERALTAGPWHQPSPFHCFYCSAEFHADTHYPYCSATCAIHAENS